MGDSKKDVCGNGFKYTSIKHDAIVLKEILEYFGGRIE
jgi:hypothetical protein